MKKKITAFLKWFLPLALLAGVGAGLVSYSSIREKEARYAYILHQAAGLAFELGDPKAAYSLYVQSSFEFEDPHLKAAALYEAATVGWAGEVADYKTLVSLYQQALRYDPELYEASFNLEYLYWLKENAPEQIPEPLPGDLPTREGDPTSGDV